MAGPGARHLLKDDLTVFKYWFNQYLICFYNVQFFHAGISIILVSELHIFPLAVPWVL